MFKTEQVQQSAATWVNCFLEKLGLHGFNSVLFQLAYVYLGFRAVSAVE